VVLSGLIRLLFAVIGLMAQIPATEKRVYRALCGGEKFPSPGRASGG
jgi:hypothetical protein